jgi:hypothetical protein
MSVLKVGRPTKEKLLHQLGNKPEISKMSLNIEKNFYKDIKFYALEHDLTITELIHKALHQYMQK